MMPLAALCFVWAGMILGISFLETPIKFTAPSVTLPIGLDIGRHVFGVFNKVEVAGAILVCALTIWLHLPRTLWLPLAVVVLIVALQTFWLLPLLDARVEMILNGMEPPKAPYHLVYIVLEVLKLGGLIMTGIFCLKSLSASAG